MKKLSVLIALMLCITIGGVYATWTYTSTSADIVDRTKEVVVELTEATTTGAAGTFAVTSNLALKIEQINNSDGTTDHKGELVFESTDGSAINLTVTFTPSGSASQDIKDNAVPAELYFSTTTDMLYPADETGKYVEGKDLKTIFNFSNISNNIFEGDVNDPNHEGKAIVWVKQEDGTFTATYNEDALKKMITLREGFALDTKADYDAFVLLLNGNIAAHVTDGTIQNSGGSVDQG